MNSRIRHFLHDEWLQLLILLIPSIAALAAMPYATEPVPMQWNLRGQVNCYAPKEWGLLVIPGTMFLIYGLIFLMEATDRFRVKPEDGGLTSHGKATRSIRMAVSLLLGAICFVQIAWALGRHPDAARLIPAGAALLLAFTGNLFGKLKPNRYAGIRVPWTLRSEAVWRKTHRVAGWLYTISGLLVAGLSMIVPSQYLMAVTLIWLGLIVVVPLGVAWKAAREEGTPQASPAVQGLGWRTQITLAALIVAAAVGLQHMDFDPKHAPERKAAQIAAEHWLVNLDEGRYADAWMATGASFRKKATQASLVGSLNKYRKPAGAKISRSLRNATYKDSLPDAPPGKYVIVRFNTVFQHQPEAIETVVEEQEPDGLWQVSGYFIK